MPSLNVTVMINSLVLHNVPSNKGHGKHDVKSHVETGKLWLILSFSPGNYGNYVF